MSELSNCCGAETIPLKGYPLTCSKCGQEQPASPPAVGDVREKIAIYLLSRDEVMPLGEATIMWGNWVQDSLRGHDGDCTKQPQPCSACLVERYRTDASSILRITQEARYVKLRKGEHISSGSINDKEPVIGTDLSGNPLIRKGGGASR